MASRPRVIAIATLALIMTLLSACDVRSEVPDPNTVQAQPFGVALMSYGYQPVNTLIDDGKPTEYTFAVCTSINLSVCFKNRYEAATNDRPIVKTDGSGKLIELVSARVDPKRIGNVHSTIPAGFEDFAALSKSNQESLLAMMSQIVVYFDINQGRQTFNTPIGRVEAYIGSNDS